MKKIVNVPVEITLHGYDGKNTMPYFHEEIGTIGSEEPGDTDDIPFTSISRNVAVGTRFYLLGGDPERNHGFVATIDMSPAFSHLAEHWPEPTEEEVTPTPEPAT